MITAAYFLWIGLVLAAGYSRQLYPACAAWASWVVAGMLATRPEKRPQPSIPEIAAMLRSKTPTQWRTLMPDLTQDQLDAIKAKVAKLGDDIDAAHKAAGQNAQDNAAVTQAQATVAAAQATAAASLATANTLAQTAKTDLVDLTTFLESLVADPAPATAKAAK
jgi:hypothetical protein